MSEKKVNIIFALLLLAAIGIILSQYRHLTASEKYHCMVTSTDKSICH